MNQVIVIGSGAAGFAAALAARAAGARTTVVEATPTLGGTTALSSGAAWLPGSRPATTAGDDGPGRTRQYLHALNGGSGRADVLDRFIEQAPGVATWLEETTPIEFGSLPIPDSHSKLPGGDPSGCRSLEPYPFRPEQSVSVRLRRALPWRVPLTLTELLTGAMTSEVVTRRRQSGTLTGGQALIAALLSAAIDAGIEIHTSTRVTRLRNDGVEIDGHLSRGRIVLATGGFERDPALADTYLGTPIRGLTGAPGARGDGLRMAIAAGAALANMEQAWWCPTVRVPGDTIDDEPVFRILLAERARPGSLMINQAGRRFTNEASTYHNVGRALRRLTADHQTPKHAIAWLVFDATHRRSYPVCSLLPDAPDPLWLKRATTLTDLADLIAVPGRSLTDTISRFNAAAAQGGDADFDRGASPYDRVMGDTNAPHSTLRPLTEPPFYAVPVHAGLGGTSGGPLTDADGRILRPDGTPIPGLYGAGNVVASPFGEFYPGTGTTIGSALVFGVQAGRAAARD